MSLKIVPVHGEHESKFHVVDTKASEGEQPCIIFTADSCQEAEAYLELGVAG